MIFRRLLRDVSFYLFTAQQVGGSKMGVADVMRLCVSGAYYHGYYVRGYVLV